MKILVTNDDGILSPVLTALAQALCREHQIMVVAPSSDQSGMSHAFTHGSERRISFRPAAVYPFPMHQVTGSPCDCVKFAIAHLYRDQKIDLVLSGVNLGENAGMSAVYSGTVAAAREAAMWGIPAIAVSVWKNRPDHLDFAVSWLLKLLRAPALLPQGPGRLWNVNFPACDPGLIEGTEFTSMSTVMFKDSYEPVVTEHGITEFRLVGYKPQEEFQPGTDDYALARNRISITPLQVDQSHPGETGRLASLQSYWDSL